MFGRRNGLDELPVERPAEQLAAADVLVVERRTVEAPKVTPPKTEPPSVESVNTAAASAAAVKAAAVKAATTVEKPSEAQQEYYNTKKLLFDALIEIIDVSQLTKMDAP